VVPARLLMTVRCLATMVAGVDICAMSTEHSVREAQSDEAGLLRDILMRAFSEYEGRLDPPSGVHSETIASIRDKMGEGGALICEVGGVVAGCVFYAPKVGYLYVGRLAVLPEYRLHGIGDLLIRAAEQRAAELGLSHIRLGVRIVLEKLRVYYAARGYVPIAFRSHDGYAEPTYVEMEKALRHQATN
jgi:GNAT superfamily N-acetyltransferase